MFTNVQIGLFIFVYVAGMAASGWEFLVLNQQLCSDRADYSAIWKIIQLNAVIAFGMFPLCNLLVALVVGWFMWKDQQRWNRQQRGDRPDTPASPSLFRRFVSWLLAKLARFHIPQELA